MLEKSRDAMVGERKKEKYKDTIWADLLDKFIADSCTQVELSQFIEKCVDYIYKQLSFQFVANKQTIDRTYPGNKTQALRDMAWDIVSSLFIHPERFSQAFSGADKKDHLRVLCGVLNQAIKQGNSVIFKERDPFGAKIYGNINATIHRNGGICENNGKITLSNYESTNQPEAPYSTLVDLFMSVYKQGMPSTIILKKILSDLTNDKEYDPAISPQLFISLYKEMMALYHPIADHAEPNQPLDTEQEALELVLRKAMAGVEKILDKYINKKIIPADQKQSYLSAVKDMIFKSDGDGDVGARDILGHYLNLEHNLTTEEYRSKYRPIFEHLVRTAREKFKKYAKEINS